MQENFHLPRWIYLALGTIAAAIGLASSGVTAKFFILGLERLETDPSVRHILMATGLLMIATELVAFGIAAMLPTKMRSLRIKLIAVGVMLLAFEVATICVTQGALDQMSEASASATQQRVQELQTAIQARRLAAQSLRNNGNLQSASANAWTRNLGATALRDAIKAEEQIESLATKLAQAQEAARPTSTSVLGERGVQVYGFARGLLISAMGLVMFGAAGALLREGLSKPNPQSTKDHAATQAPTEKLLVKAPAAKSLSAAPKTTSKTPNSLAPLRDRFGPGKEWWRKVLPTPVNISASAA